MKWLQHFQDQYREEEIEEFRELQRELEVTAKNCRVLQFKLRKVERTKEQVRNLFIQFHDVFTLKNVNKLMSLIVNYIEFYYVSRAYCITLFVTKAKITTKRTTKKHNTNKQQKNS